MQTVKLQWFDSFTPVTLKDLSECIIPYFFQFMYLHTAERQDFSTI